MSASRRPHAFGYNRVTFFRVRAMLLNAPTLNAGSQNVPLSFKALGHVIEAVGTPDFVSRLALLLNEIVPLNVVHIERSHVDSSMPTGFRCEWVGSSGVGVDSGTISEVMTLYYDRFYESDPLFAGIRGKVGTLLVVRDIGAISQ